MLVTVAGMVIFVSAAQSENILLGICVMLSYHVTDDSVVIRSQNPSGIIVTSLPNTTALIPSLLDKGVI